jgi:hypothetical protein
LTLARLVGGDLPAPPGPAGRAGAGLAGAACAVALLATAPARAEGGDGVYGRFDGDIELRAHVGAAFASGGPGLAASVAALYLSTAGIYVHYTDALGSAAPQVSRSLSAGLHLAPLFLGRYGINAERGPAFFDLLLDSFAFELGAVWSAPRAAAVGAAAPLAGSTWDEHPGMEAALDLGVPLFARASGLFIGLRGALRWRPGDFVAGVPGDAGDRGAVLSLTLGWHQVLRTHLVDAGDVVRR